MLEIASLVAAAGGLVLSRGWPPAALIALCLLARGSLDVPIPALLLVVAAIAVPAYAEHAQVKAPVPSPTDPHPAERD
jgi:hypothetical protein